MVSTETDNENIIEVVPELKRVKKLCAAVTRTDRVH